MPIPVITIAEMREWERATWAAGQTEQAVIQIVGERLARRALRLTRDGDAILILAGRGHNGDDARCAEPHLMGRRVEVINVADPAADRHALRTALNRRPALVIDGLFGIGLNRALSADWVQFLDALNCSRLPVLAVDVPSGLDALTGLPMGGAVASDVTLTLGAAKVGLLQPAAVPYVGRLEVEPAIGLVPCPFAGERQWTLPEDFVAYPPRRPAGTHKGSYGHLDIVAGSLGYHGAAVLAARGAQRAQPGLISLFPQPAVYGPVASQLQSVMVQPWQAKVRRPESSSALLFGPGLAAADAAQPLAGELVSLWRDLPLPMVVDASALDWLPEGPTAVDSLRVITPHPGEAARLLKVPASAVQSDRLNALRELSRRFGRCWVVLKGHQTLIGHAEGPVFVNPSGNPHLAQGGSGDLLAGYLAGLLAQPALHADPSMALRYAVWQHGRAADELAATRPHWTVEDLAEWIGGGRSAIDVPIRSCGSGSARE